MKHTLWCCTRSGCMLTVPFVRTVRTVGLSIALFLEVHARAIRTCELVRVTAVITVYNLFVPDAHQSYTYDRNDNRYCAHTLSTVDTRRHSNNTPNRIWIQLSCASLFRPTHMLNSGCRPSSQRTTVADNMRLSVVGSVVVVVVGGSLVIVVVGGCSSLSILRGRCEHSVSSEPSSQSANESHTCSRSMHCRVV